MPAYAYAMNVNYSREMVRDFHEVKIKYADLTIKKLEEVVGNDLIPFSVSDEDEQFGDSYVVTWHVLRPETDAEMNSRIVKAEKYNAARAEFIAKVKGK